MQEMRRIVTALFKHVVSQLTRYPTTAPIRVTLAIVDRLVEGALSVELLCQKNRVRDAAIILLSLHELRLDLQYIALDLDRADIWLDLARPYTRAKETVVGCRPDKRDFHPAG